MITRRDFIKGLVFTSCGLLDAARAQSPVRRREIVVSGRRVRTIDVHAHCAFPEAMALMGRKVAPASLVMAEDRIRAMDEQGIDMEALSINPNWYGVERDVVSQVIRLQNEKLAELCAARPDRFVAFASVALQYPELAVEQLDYAVKKLGLRGAGLGGSVNGEELSNPKFHPFWARAEELGVLIFIHPQGTAELKGRLQGNGGLENTIGNPLETTLALSHLIFEGTLDRFPGLKICAAHGGGYLPSYAPRSDHICLTFRARPNILSFCTLTRWCCRPRPCSISRRRSARASSSWAPTIRSRGLRLRSTTSSARRDSAMPSAGRCSARPPRSCCGSSLYRLPRQACSGR